MQTGLRDRTRSPEKFYRIDLDPFEYCLLVLISGYFFCGIQENRSAIFLSYRLIIQFYDEPAVAYSLTPNDANVRGCR